MEPGQIFVLSVVAIIASSFALSSFAAAWAVRRKKSAVATPEPRLEAIEVRLARMEEAIESVAVEMERVAEGQRFTARVLSERPGSAATAQVARAVPPSDPRLVTPH